MSEQNTSAEDAKFFTCGCGGKVSVDARQCPHCGDPDAVNKAYMRGDIVKPENKTKAKTPPSFLKGAFKGVVRWLVVFPSMLAFAIIMLFLSFIPSLAAEGEGVVVIMIWGLILSLALYYLFWQMGKKPDNEQGNKRRDKRFATVAAVFSVLVLIGMYLNATRELTPEEVAQVEAKQEERKKEEAEEEAKRKAEREERKEAERERMRAEAAKAEEEKRKEAEQDKKAKVAAGFEQLGYARIRNNLGGVFRIYTFTFSPQATPQDIRAHGGKQSVSQPGFTQVFYYPRGTSSIPHYELSAVQEDGIDAVHNAIRRKLDKGAKWHYVFMHGAGGSRNLYDCVKYPEGDPAGVLCPGQL